MLFYASPPEYSKGEEDGNEPNGNTKHDLVVAQGGFKNTEGIVLETDIALKFKY